MNTTCRIVCRNALQIIVLLLVLSCAGRMAAQDRVFRVWDANDGLSQVSVTAITTDAQRRLWVGTADGINLFDGIRFTSYRQSSSDLLNLRSNYVAEDFIEESDSTLLVIFKDGVYRFHLETGALAPLKLEYDPTIGRPNDFFYAGRNQQGNFIFVQSGFIHLVEAGASEALTLAYFPKSGFMKSLWIGNDELVCHTSDGLAVVNVTTHSREVIPYPDNKRIDVFKLTHEAGVIVLCTSQGALWFNPNTRTFQHALPSHITPIYDYWIDEVTGEWWLACGLEGIRIVHPERGLTGHYQMNDPLKGIPTSGFVRLLESNQDGLLWIGIDGGGLAATTVLPSEWKRFASGNPAGLTLPSNFVRSMYWTGDALLLGTLNGGLVSYDPERDITARVALGTTNSLSVSQLTSDQEGRIWAACDKGLFVSSDRGAHFKQVNGCGQFPIKLVHQAVPLRSGEVLISSEQGLWLSMPGSDCVELVTSQYVFYWMFQDRKGRLWGSSYYGPLYQFELVRNTSGLEIEITERIAEQFNVRNYAEDKDRGVIWMATEKGLLEFRGTMEESRLWTMSDGLANDFIYSLYLDAHGRVWFSSNKGIGLLEPETGYVRNFSTDDGLQCNEFNTHALAVTSDGLMYWGGTTGFNSVSSSAFLGELRDPLAGIVQAQTG
jgi:ligand-binding sensor domain-containing protein